MSNQSSGLGGIFRTFIRVFVVQWLMRKLLRR